MPSRRDLLKAGGGALAVAAAGVGARWGAWTPAVHSPAENTWPQHRYGPGNTGYSPDASPPGSNPVAVQRYDTGESANTVVVDEDRMYVGTEHSVWAFERGDDRHSEWDEPGNGWWLAVGSDAVVAAGRGRVTGFDPTTGEVLWERRPEASAYGVLVGERTAYVGFRGRLVAYHLESGERQWVLDADGEVFPGVSDGRLVVGGDGLRAFEPRGPLRGVLADAPRKVWETDEPFGGTHPVDTGDHTLVGTQTGLQTLTCGLAAVGSDGGIDWQVELGNNAGRVAFDGERAYAVSMRYDDGESGVHYSDDTTLHALDPATGDELWSFQRGGWFSSPVVADGTVYVGEAGSPNGNGNLHALDAETGDLLWTFDRAEGVNALAAVGDVLYVATDGGRVLALA
ncbi:outer membrane protein assembly factor BamB family protein [Halobacterium jilantaiense]|uniref:Tat (Twin-arginine translocation) pathway signal sequence n=1 Tax=Halobacterium jilantaiense TaxID=355548 RepID=A0A1I0PPL8_9EURY|nr:PQQ-binding-like beta-propeller repeat protein [Halobacterium jilantaiense]SEW16292.1 Tat (twin-arginine translocation) pathway signal sequence [Halobacterium jilantaiense]